jgi:hypothetical protein
LVLLDGRWTAHLISPDAEYRTGGTYVVSGDRLTFTDGADPYCFGSTWSARWSVDGPNLHLADVQVEPSTMSACDARTYGSTTRAIIETARWRALARYAIGG